MKFRHTEALGDRTAWAAKEDMTCEKAYVFKKINIHKYNLGLKMQAYT